ncbi:MAG: microcystinase C [marine bacterium B5-7]|nr:MAG: microcystinase C [marine bacterium B5-7]
MSRVAVAGWQHETNTFAPVKADFNAFAEADEWPPLSFGDEMILATSGVHLPLTGALDVFNANNVEVVPIMWCSATPSAHVTTDAFERLCYELCSRIGAVFPLDGVYLDLHGAMVTEELEDGDGEIIKRVRDVVGEDVPISVSLDLHANVTDTMVRYADVIDIYRTYPHIDMGETGARAATHLLEMIHSGVRWDVAFRRTDFLIPLNWGCTLIEPAKGIYDVLARYCSADVPVISFACGFPLSDIKEAGPTIIAYGKAKAATHVAEDILALVNDREGDFRGMVYAPDEAIAQALTNDGTGPVILADTQDNPGGGGPGDTTGLLKALVNTGVDDALLGALADADFAARCSEAGVGASFSGNLGEHSAMPGHTPFFGRFEVLALSDGRFMATGPMYFGARMELGQCALVAVSPTSELTDLSSSPARDSGKSRGLRVLVTSKAVQTADQSIFAHIGIDPAAERIIALKSSVHFRNDFSDIASKILIVAAPGPVTADIGCLDYQRLPEDRRR